MRKEVEYFLRGLKFSQKLLLVFNFSPRAIVFGLSAFDPKLTPDEQLVILEAISEKYEGSLSDVHQKYLKEQIDTLKAG